MLTWSPLPRTVAAALRDARDGRVAVRASAARDLGRWAEQGDAACLAELGRLLSTDQADEVSAAAVLALADAGAADRLPEILTRAARPGPRTLAFCLVAVGELAPHGHAGAVALLEAQLGANAPAIRYQALIAAGRVLPDAPLGSALSSAFGDPDVEVRHIACRLLEEHAARFASASLTLLAQAAAALLVDEAVQVRLAAAMAILRLERSCAPETTAQATRVLVLALAAPGSKFPPDDEQHAMDLCAERGLHEALPALRARAWGGWLRAASPCAFQAQVALARLGDERALAHITRGLASRSRRTTALAVEAAGQARLLTARPLLEALLCSPIVDRGLVEQALERLAAASS